jgi:hypothetical protein
MTMWTAEELNRIGEAEELRIASHRKDGTLWPFVIIWVVRAGDDLYVRSAYGATNPWFARAKASGTGRIQAGGVEHDVHFAEPVPDGYSAIDAAYHAKYDHYGQPIVDTVMGDEVRDVTIRLVPREN